MWRCENGTVVVSSQLSEVHGVSRQTVRRVFQDLVTDGLVSVVNR